MHVTANRKASPTASVRRHVFPTIQYSGLPPEARERVALCRRLPVGLIATYIALTLGDRVRSYTEFGGALCSEATSENVPANPKF